MGGEEEKSLEADISAKLQEVLGEDGGNSQGVKALTEYVWLLLQNGKTGKETHNLLCDFVGERGAREFTIWLLGRMKLSSSLSAKAMEFIPKEKQQAELDPAPAPPASKVVAIVAPNRSEEGRSRSSSTRRRDSASSSTPFSTGTRKRPTGDHRLLSSAMQQSVTSTSNSLSKRQRGMKGGKFPIPGSGGGGSTEDPGSMQHGEMQNNGMPMPVLTMEQYHAMMMEQMAMWMAGSGQALAGGRAARGRGGYGGFRGRRHSTRFAQGSSDRGGRRGGRRGGLRGRGGRGDLSTNKVWKRPPSLDSALATGR